MDGRDARDGRAQVVGMLGNQQDLCQRRRVRRTVHRRAAGPVRACSPMHGRRCPFTDAGSPMHGHRCTVAGSSSGKRDDLPTRMRAPARGTPSAGWTSVIDERTGPPDEAGGATRISGCAPARSHSATAAARARVGGAEAMRVVSTGCCAGSSRRDPPAPDAATATSQVTAATTARTGHGARTSAWGVWRKRRSPTASLFAVG